MLLVASSSVATCAKACTTAAAFFCVFLVPAPSRFLDDLDKAASWNVANAGVDGLLALPLFVVTMGTDANSAASCLSISSVRLSRLPAAFDADNSGFSASFLAFSVFIVALLSLALVSLAAPLTG